MPMARPAIVKVDHNPIAMAIRAMNLQREAIGWPRRSNRVTLGALNAIPCLRRLRLLTSRP
jgi:hypothetical protein